MEPVGGVTQDHGSLCREADVPLSRSLSARRTGPKNAQAFPGSSAAVLAPGGGAAGSTYRATWCARAAEWPLSGSPPRAPTHLGLPPVAHHSRGFTGLILAAVAIVAAFMIIQYYSP